MPKTKTKKTSTSTVFTPRIPKADYQAMDNKTIRQFVYYYQLALKFRCRYAKEVRQASKTELANFCQTIYQEQQK